MKKHYQLIIRHSERYAEQGFFEQILDPAHEYYGGFRQSTGLIEAKHAIYRITTMCALYCNDQSRYYQDPDVKNRISIALDFVARVQHENGLFDYIDCNFFSAPDTAFCVKRLLPSWEYLHTHNIEPELCAKMQTIIVRGAEGMTHGGFHTPNHRWAIASMLVQLDKYFNRPEFTECAKKYLAEGIDCNKDGEFAEKSAGNYNRINNDAMITLGDCTGDQFYYDCAIRNLRMMLTYLEPNGSIFTANSTRQDNGALIYPGDYYTEYLAMGHDFDIPEFLDAANYIFEIIEKNNLGAPDFLMQLMNRPDLIELEHEGVYRQPDFCRFYEESGICRVHKNSTTWTVLKGKSNFLYFTNGEIVLELKIAGSFCEHRAFVSDTMTRRGEESAFDLSQTMHGWYYLPFGEAQETTDWWKMDNQNRRQKLMGPDINIQVSVEAASDADGEGIDLHMKLDGVKPAPFRVEIASAGAEFVSGESFELPANRGGGMIVKSGTVSFFKGIHSISVGNGFAEHRYVAGKFGSESASSTGFTVYFTDNIPFERTIRIRAR